MTTLPTSSRLSSGAGPGRRAAATGRPVRRAATNCSVGPRGILGVALYAVRTGLIVTSVCGARRRLVVRPSSGRSLAGRAGEIGGTPVCAAVSSTRHGFGDTDCSVCLSASTSANGLAATAASVCGTGRGAGLGLGYLSMAADFICATCRRLSGAATTAEGGLRGLSPAGCRGDDCRRLCSTDLAPASRCRKATTGLLFAAGSLSELCCFMSVGSGED